MDTKVTRMYAKVSFLMSAYVEQIKWTIISAIQSRLNNIIASLIYFD